MAYLKYIQYFYLIAAFLFAVDGFMQLNDAGRKPWISFFFAAIALFMFFFRRKFAKKMEGRKNNRQ
ncbi:MAG TPA: hypothetical protein VFR70_04385 [Flavobacterium sp.]|nr:hypothetical protein [Flavobacterium sp.]